MATAIKIANRRKHRPLNEAISLDEPARDDAPKRGSIGEAIGAPDADPADLVIMAERITEVKRFLGQALTELEQQVLDLYLEGNSYVDIAHALERQVRSIDNALQRVMGKLRQWDK